MENRITLVSPVGREADHSDNLAPLVDPRGKKLAFLFNGHVSVLPFWRQLEKAVDERCDPSQVLKVVKPNTFAPATQGNIAELSGADLALVGVCA
jgi:hypothetical protein